MDPGNDIPLGDLIPLHLRTDDRPARHNFLRLRFAEAHLPQQRAGVLALVRYRPVGLLRRFGAVHREVGRPQVAVPGMLDGREHAVAGQLRVFQQVAVVGSRHLATGELVFPPLLSPSPLATHYRTERVVHTSYSSQRSGSVDLHRSDTDAATYT